MSADDSVFAISLSRLNAHERQKMESRASNHGNPHEILVRVLKRFGKEHGFNDEEAHAVYFRRYERMRALGLGWLADEMQAEERALKEEHK